MYRDPRFNDNTYVYSVAPGMISNALERHHPDYAGNSTESQYYQYDHRGNVAVASDATGRIEAGYQYDAFGNVLPGSFTPAVEETEFALPSAGADIGGGDSYWHDAGNITKESDCAYLEQGGGLTAGLKASGFGQEIPAGATILGVEVQIRKDASADVYDGVVSLYNGVTETLIGANKAKPDGWPDDPGTVTYGGPDDTWGAALTPDILNHGGTGIVIQGYIPDGERSLNVHWVKLKVYYTEGDAPGPAILFTGKDYDRDLELYYFNARWYDPETARFLSRPEFSSDIEHPYVYCGNNPLAFSDPRGTLGWGSLIGLGGIVGAIGGIAAIVGLIVLSPPLAVGGAVVGTIGGITSFVGWAGQTFDRHSKGGKGCGCTELTPGAFQDVKNCVKAGVKGSVGMLDPGLGTALGSMGSGDDEDSPGRGGEPPPDPFEHWWE